MTEIARTTAKNYKNFDSIDVSWRPLNIVYGPNSTGKTSLVQLPIVCLQFLPFSQPPPTSSGGGRVLSQGLREVLGPSRPHSFVEFGIDLSADLALVARLQLLQNQSGERTIPSSLNIGLRGGGDRLVKSTDLTATTLPTTWAMLIEPNQHEVALPVFDRLQRLEATALHLPAHRPVLLSSYESTGIDTDAGRRLNLESAPYLLLDRPLAARVRSFYEKALPGTQLEVISEGGSFRVQSRGLSATRAGRGLANSLAMITLLEAVCHGLTRPPVCVVEEPEAHLHPSAHPALADLLLSVSKRTQLFVETHSEALLLRLQRRVAEGGVGPEHIRVVYLSATRETSVVDVSADGTLSDWPESLFDTAPAEAAALTRARLKARG